MEAQGDGDERHRAGTRAGAARGAHAVQAAGAVAVRLRAGGGRHVRADVAVLTGRADGHRRGEVAAVAAGLRAGAGREAEQGAGRDRGGGPGFGTGAAVTGMMSEGMRIYIGEVTDRPAEGVCHVTHSRAQLRRGRQVVKYRECPWFNFEEASLTPSEADRALTGFSGSPRHERTMYLVFSLRPEERERLGMPEERLYEAM